MTERRANFHGTALPAFFLVNLEAGADSTQAVRIVQHHLEECRDHSAGLAIVFLDISNGFGALNLKTIYPCLVAMGVDPAAARFIKIMTESVVMQLEGTKFPIKVGNLQGSPTSPLVYCLVQNVANLYSKALNQHQGRIISFMDDSAGVYFDDTEAES